MTQKSGFEYFEVEFDRSGKLFNKPQLKALADHVAGGAVTDLIVMSHGWNNDMTEARTLYANWLANARAGLVAHGANLGLGARTFAFAGVLWPSKRFADDELIAGGGAASAGGGAVAIAAQIDELKLFFSSKEQRAALTKLKKLAPKLETSKSARTQFVEVLRDALTDGQDDGNDANDQFFKLDGHDVFERMAAPKGKKKKVVEDEGGAAGIGDFFRNAWEGARNVLNLSTYYEMKARAGLVGINGVNPMLVEIQKRAPKMRVHLVGHSFGGRVVAATADGADHESKLRLASMTLLQAAFSHNGFAKKFDGKRNGFFRRVIEDRRIDGPIVITFTKNDKAVGVAYPLAQRLNRDDAAGLGDENDRFGGIGSNGAIKTPEAVVGKLLAVGGKYALAKGKIFNLEATRYVKDHGDVAGKEVAYAALCAFAHE